MFKMISLVMIIVSFVALIASMCVCNVNATMISGIASVAGIVMLMVSAHREQEAFEKMIKRN
jgi:membrane protein implicated in regulation of membrane protease activity